MAKKIKLVSLELTNFKGVEHSKISLYDRTNLYGANESGKSTHYTAFCWLLTGKDEFDRNDYEIKNTSKTNLNKMPHTVEGILLIDGKEEIRLKKSYLEKWTKTRGEAQKTFDGHSTDYWYNDVPMAKAEFQKSIEAIVPSNLIKLITNPYFFTSLSWDKQRQGLLSIVGQIDPTSIIDNIATTEYDYSSLINILNKDSDPIKRESNLAFYKKELAAKRKLLKDSGKDYPARISEAENNKPQILDWSEIEKEIIFKKERIFSIETALLDANTLLNQKQMRLNEKQNQLFSKESELANIRHEIRQRLSIKNSLSGNKAAEIKASIESIERRIRGLKADLVSLNQSIENSNKAIAQRQSRVDELRSKWMEVNAREFLFEHKHTEPTLCPNCNYELTSGDINEVEILRLKMLAEFNESNDRLKQSYVEESNDLKDEIERIKSNIDSIDFNTVDVALVQANNELDKKRKELVLAEQKENSKEKFDIEKEVDKEFSSNKDVINLYSLIENTKSIIQSEKELLSKEPDYVTEKEEKVLLQSEIDELNKKIALKSELERAEKRIMQLIEEESVNAQAVADVERKEFELESFTSAKMDILEEMVNKMFKYVRFRLFNKLVNGSPEDTCVCEYNGVPYPTLNTAAKILSGLDIIETLSKYYGYYAPVFIDNRESVTFIPDISSQVINLIVSPMDKILSVTEA